MNTQMIQKEEALKKSKELLFVEFCHYTGLKSEEMKKKWKKFSEEEQWDLVKSFVLEWGAHFHPLSARSVKELVDDCTFTFASTLSLSIATITNEDTALQRLH